MYCELSFEELEPRSFSFNSPFGACPECSGLGNQLEVDPELVVPDDQASINEGAIAPWAGVEHFEHLLEALSKEVRFSLDMPWRKLSVRARDAILHGWEYEVQVKFRNRYGRTRTYTSGFEGVIPFLSRKHSETESEWSRERYFLEVKHSESG
jgi:excinuclease ABC subunit A